MFKKCLLFLLLISSLPVYAGKLEDALKSKGKVFLYLYTPDCGYCTKFSPRYDKLSKMYGERCAFLKVDASTPYGYELMKKYKGRYVPYVLLINSNKAEVVTPSCLSDNACIENEIRNF